MTDPTDARDDTREVEVNLANSATLDFQHVEVDADETPVSFLVAGRIHDVEADVLAQMADYTLTPVAVRFEVSTP